MLLGVGLLVASCAESHEESTADNSKGGSAATASGGESGSGGNAWPDSGAGSGGTAGTSGAGGSAGSATGGAGGTSSGGSSSGGSSSGGTGGGCVPQCSGKQCGPDSCGGTCAPGCAPTETCSGAGQCQAACSPTWYTAHAGATANGAVLNGSDLLVIGGKNKNGWVARVDTCAGGIQKEVSVIPSGGQESGLSKGVVSGGSLYAAGSVVTASDPRQGLIAKLNPSTLSVSFAKSLFGSTGPDECNAIAATSAGTLWLAGRSNTPTGPAWGVKATSSGQACGFPIGSGAGSSFAADASGTSVYVARTTAGKMYLERYTDANCSATGPCPCSPTVTGPAISLGTGSTEARALLYHSGSVYVAGFQYDVQPNGKAFVLRLSTSGAVVGRYDYDPTTLFDGFVSLAAAGNTVYAGGGFGWDQSSSFASSTGILHALPAGFGMSAVATWTRTFNTLDVLGGLAAEAGSGDGLYATGLASGAAFSMRCLKANLCPK